MNKYVGKLYVPFGRGPDAFDCWGLVMQIYKDQGIELNDYAYVSPEDIEKNEAIFNAEGATGDWHHSKYPDSGDLVVFNIAGYPVHVGIMINNRQFIHAHKSCGVAVESVNSIRWRNRLHGYYRHNDSVSLQN